MSLVAVLAGPSEEPWLTSSDGVCESTGSIFAWTEDLALMCNRSFLGQAPLFLLAILLCWVSLPNTKPRHQASELKSKKLRRVDFLGSALFAAFLILVLLPLELGGSKIAWNDPRIPLFFGLSAVSLVLLVVVEKRWASNPLLPLSMFCNRHTVAAFVITALQCAAQLGVISTVPCELPTRFMVIIC